MRFSRLFGKTLRSDPVEAETPSHRLLLRGGFIHPLAAGLYSALPLGWKVQQRIEQIIREEMNAAGGQEIKMLVPSCASLGVVWSR
jgi:prolyl-tRNA synthetase